MLKKLKHLLQSSSAYPAIRKLYLTMKPTRLRELMIGTRARMYTYINKPISFTERSLSEEWINHPSKRYLIEKISIFAPFDSILEVGCNAGPNLFHLAKRFPEAHIYGVDININSVNFGNKWFAERGFNNVRLFVGKADDLTLFKRDSVDVVFTNALLVVIGRDKIERVIGEMIRIARRGLLFMEWHDFDSLGRYKDALGVYHLGFWKRDYISLLTKFVSRKQINVTKIPAEVWPDEGWSTLGAVIEVRLE